MKIKLQFNKDNFPIANKGESPTIHNKINSSINKILKSMLDNYINDITLVPKNSEYFLSKIVKIEDELV